MDYIYELSKPPRRSPIVSVTVSIELQGEDYRRYAAKYYGETDNQTPSIPSSWLMDVVDVGATGEDHRSWKWKFHGPEMRRDDVMKSIKEFLEGFPCHILD